MGTPSAEDVKPGQVWRRRRHLWHFRITAVSVGFASTEPVKQRPPHEWPLWGTWEFDPTGRASRIRVSRLTAGGGYEIVDTPTTYDNE